MELKEGQQLTRKEDGANVMVISAGIFPTEIGLVPRLNLREESGKEYSVNLRGYEAFYQKTEPA